MSKNQANLCCLIFYRVMVRFLSGGKSTPWGKLKQTLHFQLLRTCSVALDYDGSVPGINKKN